MVAADDLQLARPAMDDGPEGKAPFSPEALAFCQSLPKVELHAHLNGSVRDATIRHLAAEKGLTQMGLTAADVDNITSKRQRSLQDCFLLFNVIHACTTDLPSITRITREVIADFAADNVLYLELRTTPKARPELGMTKANYTRAVLEGMRVAQEHERAQGRWICVRLLLSIDRRESTEAALETVRLAAGLQGEGVVGVDLCGNPCVGTWPTWSGALEEARSAGLRVTLHAGEVPAREETAAMLSFKPDRLGHMCCMDEHLEQQLREYGIPVELCLTSNIKTSTFQGYPDHHFASLYAAGHPVVLCTDDSGVFGTTLSQELAIAMTVFELTEQQVRQLALRALDCAFLSSSEKEEVRERMHAALAMISGAATGAG